MHSDWLDWSAPWLGVASPRAAREPRPRSRFAEWPPDGCLTCAGLSAAQITSRFAKEYLAATGISVGFRLSFGGSGTQASPCRVLGFRI